MVVKAFSNWKVKNTHDGISEYYSSNFRLTAEIRRFISGFSNVDQSFENHKICVFFFEQVSHTNIKNCGLFLIKASI